jgi:hypothetical protein
MAQINIGGSTIVLDEECWSCTRTKDGKPLMMEEDGTCSICHGEKFILTEAGQRVIDFVRRHIGKVVS